MTTDVSSQSISQEILWRRQMEGNQNKNGTPRGNATAHDNDSKNKVLSTVEQG